jgi:hypothetical protein
MVQSRIVAPIIDPPMEMQLAVLAWCACLAACEEFDRTLPGFESIQSGTWVPFDRRASDVFGSERRQATHDALEAAAAIPAATIADAWREVEALSPAQRRVMLERGYDPR